MVWMYVAWDNVKRLRETIRACNLCPQCCGVDRTRGQPGSCGIGQAAVVSSAGAHFGEEPVLVGAGGSGTIFFSSCNLDCQFCQNFDISHSTAGRVVSPRRLARVMCELARSGCANINFVTPTHVAHAVAEAICLARAQDLAVPVVYNCGGYESVRTLQLLEGLIEIYMPDFKYADAAAAKKYSGAENYPSVAAAALAEMYRQVGPLELDEKRLAVRGVLVRHLVMPNNIARSREVIDIVARTAPGCAINVMGQYRPTFRAANYPELLALVEPREVRELRDYAASCGLTRVDY